MTQDEFEHACGDLMDALCDAGFTDASVGSEWPRCLDCASPVAEVNCMTPDEVVKLTRLIRTGVAFVSPFPHPAGRGAPSG